jgi:signal transduction histidine kinase/ActR/RegA family two-component response regulator
MLPQKFWSAWQRRPPWVVRVVHPLRVMGSLFICAALFAALHERVTPTSIWVYAIVQPLLWPWLSHLHARLAGDPKNAERHNLLLDAFFSGTYAALLQFALVPSASIAWVALTNCVTIGGPRLGLQGLIAAGAGIAATVAVTGLHYQPDVGFWAAAIPALGILTYCAVLAVSGYRNASYLLQVQQQLRQAQAESEAANQAKSRFVAMVSHELRTPMNAVIGFTGLALRADSNARRLEYLQHIESASNTLLRLVNHVLDLSKIEAGKIQLQPRNFSLDSVTERLMVLVGSQASAKKLGIRTQCDPAVPAILRGDDQRLEQVLMNLLGNAVKFTETGEVTLDIRLQSRTAHEAMLEFVVRDTGIGLSDAQRARLFQPFVQADVSTARRFGGTGLGLAISRQLVELMGGRIEARAAPGGGSEFRFTALFGIGDVPDRDQDRQLSTDHRGQLKGVRVLLAEDHPLNRKLIHELLDGSGAILDLAENGEQAIAATRSTRYDVLLMDVQMPVVDGLEATRAIRRLPGLEALPIIAMTANALDQDRAECLEAGMNDFLPKPIDAQHLYDKLRLWARTSDATGASP